MARTDAFPFTKYRRTEEAGAPALTDFNEQIDTVIAQYESALADSDVATDLEDGSFYAGQVNGYVNALAVMLGVPEADLAGHYGTD